MNEKAIMVIFPATEKEIFKKLQRLKTLQYIAYPIATFIPVDGNNNLYIYGQFVFIVIGKKWISLLSVR